MADYQTWPIWNAEPGQFDNVDPQTLPISNRLAADLAAWAERLNATLNWNDPGGTVWPKGFWAQFNAEGATLAQRLRLELGPDYLVIHNPSGKDT